MIIFKQTHVGSRQPIHGFSYSFRTLIFHRAYSYQSGVKTNRLILGTGRVAYKGHSIGGRHSLHGCQFACRPHVRHGADPNAFLYRKGLTGTPLVQVTCPKGGFARCHAWCEWTHTARNPPKSRASMLKIATSDNAFSANVGGFLQDLSVVSSSRKLFLPFGYGQTL